MGRVIYGMGVSLDGYIEDAGGSIAWSTPDEELHRLANAQAREAAAFLFGRRLYEMMERYWVAAARRSDLPEVEAEFARAYVETPRIVFSDSLDGVTGGTRLVRSSNAVAEVRRLKERTDGHLDLGGASLAASLVELIDEFHMYVHPVIVGAGKPFFPPLADKLALRLMEVRPFDSGAVYLCYRRAG